MNFPITGFAIKKWLVRWHRRQEELRGRLRNSYLHHLLGDRIFHHHIWAMDRYSLAGGLSLGLFIAFTPTIPFQMLLAAIGALVLSVNLPLAVAACWITNPVTALPVYLSARQLGKYLLEDTDLVRAMLDAFDFQGGTGNFMRESLFLWSGSLIFSSVAALLGYMGVMLLWDLFLHRLRRRVKVQRGDVGEGSDLR